MAKKKMGLEDLGGFVFSTNDAFEPGKYDDEDSAESLKPEEQLLEAHYSSKGRAGKKVTVVKGFVGTDEDLNALGKDLKKKCGVGGSVKDGEIIIQGDVRDKVMGYLKELGYKVKRIGG
ncbi:translation initiation factor 1 (eIF-1/SUI1) [Salinimicrobium sediminis]|uniref:Translation initiation factor 1 (eIF-1/SUI1) n=1 Tax=Salinimicrobium sediminis TaxID=1343891 RepID=A0A285X4J5_9FLAO|nr:translation initiation factor [Salinimicrobium sediminis]SOC80270.1 translation initiation factor 1 (eIF-1/SUI1) [Salinimicrobium sediminis]